ncbi:MAG: hypothetical protein Q9185_006183, partial [Variospora sp. 1 TL-2023]
KFLLPKNMSSDPLRSSPTTTSTRLSFLHLPPELQWMILCRSADLHTAQNLMRAIPALHRRFQTDYMEVFDAVYFKVWLQRPRRRPRRRKGGLALVYRLLEWQRRKANGGRQTPTESTLLPTPLDPTTL